ncbi:MAG: PASTA domain-containing protein [Planctomycetales bacterium]
MPAARRNHLNLFAANGFRPPTWTLRRLWTGHNGRMLAPHRSKRISTLMWASRRTFSALSLSGLLIVAGHAASAFGQDGAPAAGGREPRNALDPAPLRIQNLDPALERILLNWSRATDKITKLHGDHERYVYDSVFATERRSKGKLYYEAPDKGRIDLTPVDVRSGDVSGMKDPQGRPYTLVKDQPEKWICPGDRIMAVNEETREVDIYPIPQAKQGRNIMEGPLPFLFGMPPDMAKQRYRLQLVQDLPERCWIEAEPRWQSDAANYRKAEILLDKRTWLPTAVRLHDPAGTKQTVYSFTNLDEGQPGILPEWLGGNKDPFYIDPRKYKFIHKAVEGPEDARAAGAPRIAPLRDGQPQTTPSRVRVAAGEETGRAALEDAALPAAAGTPTAPAAAPTPRPAAAGQFRLPSFVGMSAEEAKATVQRLRLAPTYSRGETAPKRDDVWTIYAQSPPAGTPVGEGSPVKLLYYDKPPVAAAAPER